MDPSSSAPSKTARPETVRAGHVAGLRYLEVVVGAEPDAPLPLVVFLHGRGDHAHREWIRGLREPARYVFPQASTPHGPGFTWFSYVVGEASPARVAQDVRPVAAHLAQVLTELSQARPTLGKPVVAGFSQGGHLAFALALLHPEVLSCAVPIAGDLPQPLWPSRPATNVAYPPIRALHGRADQVVHFAPTERTVAALRDRGFDVSLRAFDGAAHELREDMHAALFAELRRAIHALQR